MAAEKHHPFHIIELSPWPIITAFSLLFVMGGAVMLMHSDVNAFYNFKILGDLQIPQRSAAISVFAFGNFVLLYSVISWWRDVIDEAIEDNSHTEPVRHGLRIGMALFILSEVMFFFAFFWSFFKAWLFPVAILDGYWPVEAGIWPPKNVETFDPWNLPFINTLILLLSGTTVTWAHHALIHNNQKDLVRGLGLTVLLGIFFTCLQAFEYSHAPFGFKDGIYSSNFYIATGFHGLHVIIGTIFLAVCYFRAKKGHFEEGKGHLGFEFAAWYWHFVDVVWLFLFLFVYVLAR